MSFASMGERQHEGRDVSCSHLDSTVFTFRPELNKTSRRIVQEMSPSSTFLERQQQYLQRRNSDILNSDGAGPAQLLPCRPKQRKQSQPNKGNKSRTAISGVAISASHNAPANVDEDKLDPYGAETLNNINLSSQYNTERKIPAGLTQRETVVHMDRPRTSRSKSVEGQVDISSLRATRSRALRRTRSLAAICTCTSLHCDHPSHFKPEEKKKPIQMDETRKKELELQRELRDIIASAAKKRKIFTIYAKPDQYPEIRETLIERGWIEKPPPREDDVVTFRTNLNGCRPMRSRRTSSHTPTMLAPTDADESDDSDSDDDDPDTSNIPDAECNKITLRRITKRLGTRFIGQEGIVASVLNEFPPYFIWSPKLCKHIHRASLQDDQIINGFKNTGCFTTKVGLTKTLRGINGFVDITADNFYPKCFDIANEEDRGAFIEYYVKLAACSVLIKRKDWMTPPAVLLIALDYVESFVKERNHEDLDIPMAKRQLLNPDLHAMLIYMYSKLGEGPELVPFPPVPPQIRDLSKKTEFDSPAKSAQSDIDAKNNKQTDDFGRNSRAEYSVPVYNDKFLEQLENGRLHLENIRTSRPSCENMENRIAAALAGAAEHDVQYNIQGNRNVWVIKPGAKSRGRGIFCENRLDLILHAASNAGTKDKFVAQKYIERPMIVHDTKFDIRQYYVVTSWSPLTIYFYKDCYVRFSSSKYKLDDLRSEEAKYRHLCNNAIQEQAKDFGAESWNEGCMWDSDQLKKYLADQGHPNVWSESIYTGMKEIINQTMIASQEAVIPRKNTFELFGADFIVDENFKPWLIEINVSPSLSKSTPATEKLVTSCLKDTIALVLDKKIKKTELGTFELSLQQPKLKHQLNVGPFLISGDHIKRPRKPNTGAFARIPGSSSKAPHPGRTSSACSKYPSNQYHQRQATSSVTSCRSSNAPAAESVADSDDVLKILEKDEKSKVQNISGGSSPPRATSSKRRMSREESRVTTRKVGDHRRVLPKKQMVGVPSAQDFNRNIMLTHNTSKSSSHPVSCMAKLPNVKEGGKPCTSSKIVTVVIPTTNGTSTTTPTKGKASAAENNSVVMLANALANGYPSRTSTMRWDRDLRGERQSCNYSQDLTVSVHRPIDPLHQLNH